MSEWQSIETAPENCTLLLWPSEFGTVFPGYWNDGSGSWSRLGDFEYNPQRPSHWMLLPPPPALTATNRE